MGADMESGCVKEYLVKNPNIELTATSIYDLAEKLLKLGPESAALFITWITSTIKSETGKIDRNAGVSIFMHLIGIFSVDIVLLVFLINLITSGDWIKKLTEEQRAALCRCIIDHRRPKKTQSSCLDGVRRTRSLMAKI